VLLDATCPKCGKQYHLPQKLAGKSVRCKECQTVFVLSEISDGGELELAEQPVTTPRATSRPVAPRAQIVEEDPAHVSAARRAVDVILGPRDGSFWITTVFLILSVIACISTGSAITILCSSLVVAILMSFAGAVWAARLMLEQGIPVRFIVVAIVAPVLFIPALLLTSMLTERETYRGPLYCQLRAGLMILVMIVSGNIAAAREKTAHDAKFQQQLRAAQTRAAASGPATEPGK
jgi:hypothetical protein